MKPRELRDLDPARLTDLDVRPDLRAGREPFPRIMRARRELAGDGVLRLRAPFEPRPLYDVLGRDGFRHWTERLADDDWRVWFFRDGPSASHDPGPERLPEGGASSPDAPGVHVLDVRGLEPPEPMARTLEALEALPDGHTLVQVNLRVPRFLLPELEARGFDWTVLEETREVVRLAIRRTA